jgi:tetratricopeptide (TPR) repeat protein
MLRIQRWLYAPVLLLAPLPAALPLRAANLSLPPSTAAILDHIYSGKREQALSEIHELQQKFPTHPLPVLLEAEAEWWRIWCVSAEYKYGMTMARHHDKSPADQAYLELARKAYKLAEEGLREHETGEMHLYAGMADALEARLYGLRWDTRATARAGVRAREHFLNALARDPSLADAYTGLGLYNYYVDTLSAVARVIRFFMGVPGGSKEEGIRQLNRGIHEGQLTPMVARFYLALNLENYDQHYEEALRAIGPLTERYPENPTYLLVQGDLYAKLGRKKQAESSYRAALAAAESVEEPPCRTSMTQLARESLAAVTSK